jgi:hypothetical protein
LFYCKKKVTIEVPDGIWYWTICRSIIQLTFVSLDAFSLGIGSLTDEDRTKAGCVCTLSGTLHAYHSGMHICAYIHILVLFVFSIVFFFNFTFFVSWALSVMLMHGLEWPPCHKNSPDTFFSAFCLSSYTEILSLFRLDHYGMYERVQQI